MGDLDTMIFAVFGLIFAAVVTVFVTQFFVEGIAANQRASSAADLLNDFRWKAEFACSNDAPASFEFNPPEEDQVLEFDGNEVRIYKKKDDGGEEVAISEDEFLSDTGCELEDDSLQDGESVTITRRYFLFRDWL